MFDAIAPGRIHEGPLAGAWKLTLTVDSVAPLTPSMRVVRLTAPDLETLEYDAGQDLMLAVPTESGDTTNRRYTIRRLDPVARTVDLEIVVHGEGPGARWAASTRPGDAIVAIGPRGKVKVRDDAEWHLFVADESGVPATLAMLEALPQDARAIVLFDVADEGEVRPDSFDERVEITWLLRGDAAPHPGELLPAAVQALAFPAGRGVAYLAAERSVVNAVRDGLRARGFAGDQIDAKAYWRADQANAPHGEPARDETGSVPER